jgi:hypothetical protein
LGIYNTFDWGDGTLYGDASKVAYSAAPLTATAIGSSIYNEQVIVDSSGNLGLKEVTRPRVDLSWENPTGSIFGFRIVRNQDGFSEHEEDGQVILETFIPAKPLETEFTDELHPIPLIEGRYAYYTVWLLLADFSWIIGAYTYCVIPTEHDVKTPEGNLYKTSERKFIEMFPKVYTTDMQSYVDEVSETSDLRLFLGGFAYTLDEILTSADLLVPDFSGKLTNPNMVGLQAQQLGLPKESTLSLLRKKALVRNSFGITKFRGSLESVQLLSKSLTGFLVETSISPNLLLNIQDSSFYKGVGNWNIATNGVLTANLTTGSTDLPVQTETYSVDKSYTGKVVTSSSNVVLSLGSADPRLTGVPVNAEEEYEFSYYVKGAAFNVTPSIRWYNRLGQIIGTAVVGTAAAAGSSWSTRKTQKATSPVGAQFASIELSFAAAGTYYVDMVQFAKTNDPLYETYYEARSLDIRLQPTKVNLLNNPSMSSATDWTLTGATGDYTETSTLPGVSLDGTKMTAATTTLGTDFSLVSETDSIVKSGRYYTFSIYAATESGTQTASFKVEVIDASGEVLTYESGANAVGELTDKVIGTDWSRFVTSVYVPSSSDALSLRATVSGEGSGAVVNFDSAQIEEGYGASDYFDGSHVTRGAYWQGTANSSESVMYRNKLNKVDRLVVELPNYMPMNMAYTITSGFNGATVLETSGFSS